MHKFLILLAIISQMAWSQQAKRPNILVFLVDDMGMMDTSVPLMTDKNGEVKRYPLNDFYITPNMERLAKQGKAFSSFYAMSVCSPSRASIMTGLNAARHHSTQWINPHKNNRGTYGPHEWQWKGITPEDKTIVTELKKAGYKTIHAGKAHFGPIGSVAEFPDQIGFDVNIGGCSIGQPGSYYGKKNFGKGDYQVPHLEKYHGQDIFLTEALTIEMKAAISEAVKEGKPFFAHMSHYALHAPFHMDKRYEKTYAERCKKFGYNRRQQAFAALVTGMDKSLGDLMDHLENLGVAENTFIIFLGDNGTDSPIKMNKQKIGPSAPLKAYKAMKYEGGMRIPAIFSWAKPTNNKFQKFSPIKPGVVTDRFRNICDIFPTILSVAGLKTDLKFDGHSLRKILADKDKGTEKDSFLMHFPHQHRNSYFTVYRYGDWKVIYNYHAQGAARYELYNLKEDPTEQKNLAMANPELLKEMMTKMSSSLTKHEAQYPLSKSNKEPEAPVIP